MPVMTFAAPHAAMTARQKDRFFFGMSAFERWVAFIEDRRDNEGLGASTVENQQKAFRLVAFMQRAGLGDLTAPAEPWTQPRIKERLYPLLDNPPEIAEGEFSYPQFKKGQSPPTAQRAKLEKGLFSNSDPVKLRRSRNSPVSALTNYLDWFERKVGARVAPLTRIAESEEQAAPARAVPSEPDEEELASSDEEDVDDDEERPVGEAVVHSCGCEPHETASQSETAAASRAQALEAAAQESPQDCDDLNGFDLVLLWDDVNVKDPAEAQEDELGAIWETGRIPSETRPVASPAGRPRSRAGEASPKNLKRSDGTPVGWLSDTNSEEDQEE